MNDEVLMRNERMRNERMRSERMRSETMRLATVGRLFLSCCKHQLVK